MSQKIRPALALWGTRMAFMSYGWDAGVLGGVLETAPFQDAMKHPSTTTLSMIVAAFLLASWLGCCIVASPWSDRVGRRMWVISGAAIQIVGTIISTASYSSGQMIAGRTIIGIGNGIVVASAPVYIAEITPATSMRGPLIGILMGFACTGTTLAYWVDFAFTHASGQVVWRVPVGLQVIWSLLTIILTWPNMDSPRWYYLRNRDGEGLNVLQQLYPDQEVALRVQGEILKELREEKEEKLQLSNLIFDKSPTQAMRRIRDGVVLVGVAYLMGINMIFYYMTTIFHVYIGLPAKTSSCLSGAATTLLAIGVFVGSYFCEKSGRRKWLLWGSATQSVFIIAFTGLLAAGKKTTSSAAAAMLFGWILVFSPTWAPLPYIYVSETMPLRHRHTGVGLSMSSQWLMAFLTVYAGPIAIANVGWKAWIWFAVFNVAAFPYVYFFIRETRGRSLENMNDLFGDEHLIDGNSSSGDTSDDVKEVKAAPVSKA
ncbi:uncharacterized protein PADG_01211 [Paracoccidioides brasiliensis Pb18]|uniref:Major facilitator superfamily (MFS) profile domain-containing protein n=2 Tax=Paracoccidioides brasiliensis TaxID=121759 RepID=C1G2P5_PARBD|nr:uncharacterized protein PADG_01211 [Paracoccidioides brasiliensis Pb18]EEH45061.2 hypothetical protein PADG_01211 [Paracoccidioides brasiliensis Pb18]ODH41420.1 hypothetical protein ACO22_01380 [Paracoccidioides brasiliensis]ODH48261.1 hypothetical protein GX48_05661 [Paracoccidioides brasiliensis]